MLQKFENSLDQIIEGLLVCRHSNKLCIHHHQCCCPLTSRIITSIISPS